MQNNGSTITKVIDLVPGKQEKLNAVFASQLKEDIFWNEFVKTSTPLLIKNGAQNWEAVKKWNRDGYLESLCNKEHGLMLRTFNYLPYGVGLECANHNKKLSELIKDIRKSNNNDTFSMPTFSLPNRWDKDIGKVSFLTERFKKSLFGNPSKQVFLYKNASSEWHYHAVGETLTSQIVGTKKFSLFRLSSTDWNRYSPLIQSNLHHLSCAKSIFPEKNQIRKFEATLEPGDMIYIPPFWWHGVDPVDSDLGVTVAEGFRSPLSRLASWKEPVIKELATKLNPLQVMQLHFFIALSTVKRKIDREQWLRSHLLRN